MINYIDMIYFMCLQKIIFLKENAFQRKMRYDYM
jgi:hypothetical protein